MTAVHEPELHVALPGRDLTLDDVAELAAADSARRFELVEGILVIMPPADLEHNAIPSRLLVWLVSHGYPAERVLPNAGVKVDGRDSGRSPDLVVLVHSPSRGGVWADAADVSLVVEIVSRGSESLDRIVKPREYAQSGIPRYWRVERSSGSSPTVHMYQLGTGPSGERIYLSSADPVPLDKLLAGEPPGL